MEDEDGLVPIDFSYDAHWDKPRGFNSLICGGAAIGRFSGKVISYGVKVKKCGICSYAQHLNKEAKPHTCYKNYNGSAKSMESAIGVDIANDIRNKGATTKRITMDEDASTIKNLKKQVIGKTTIEKGSDANHIKKIFVLDLGKKKKDPQLPFKNQRGILTKEQRATFGSYMFKCIQKHHQNSEALKASFDRMIQHIWGNHSECGPWCSFKQQWNIKTMDLYIQSQLINESVPSLKCLAIQYIIIQQMEWKGLLGVDIEEEIKYVLNNS